MTTLQIEVGEAVFAFTSKQHWITKAQSWFQHIPEGLEVVSISGETYPFNKHTEDDDIRLGALSFGFITPR